MKTKLISSLMSLFFVATVVAVPFHWDVITDQNKRDYQEDRFTYASITDNNNKKLGDFFAVYDGHGGDKTSTLLEKNLHLKFMQYLYDSNEKLAFEYAFLDMEQEALNNYSDGSTVVAAYVDNITNILHYAWVGDSRLVVYYGPVTSDHKPDNKQEKERIENAGGRVMFHGVPRINGLAISRSIGDRFIKKASKEQVIAIPEYGYYQLTKDNQFMILASDGLWDVIGCEKALLLVKDALENGHSCEIAANILKNEAIKRGSRDNITILIVQFDWSQE